MKIITYSTLILSLAILGSGCTKSLTGSVDLNKGAKAGFTANTYIQSPDIYGRLCRYDVGDGRNSDCILSYDDYYGQVSLTQFNGDNSTTLYGPSIGFSTDNEGVVEVNNWWSDITDNFNEVGGVHIIPFDATGSGHENYLLLYIPGRGVALLMHYTGVGSTPWHVDWGSNVTSGSGIGGYNLSSTLDKIIAYDYGDGYNNYLMLYRPGAGINWVLNNNMTPSNPSPSGGVTWSPRIQSYGGIGGYDLKGTTDQLVEIGGPLHTYMDLAAYRPGNGIVWLLQHTANSVNWYGEWSISSGGLNGFGVDLQDRIATGASGLGSTAAVVPEDDGNFFFFRPGSGTGTTSFFTWDPGSAPMSYAPTFTGANSASLFTTNPYGTPPTNPGDKVIFFSGGDPSGYNTSMLIYTPGSGKQSQLYYLNSAGSNSYTEQAY
jgi:hypothetical protein